MKKLVLGSVLFFTLGLQPVLGAEVRTLPAEIYGQLKGDKRMGKLWISPKFDGAKGITAGTATSVVDSQYSNVTDYIPYALGRITTEGSPYTLNVTIIELTVKNLFATGFMSATLGFEGQVLDPEGNLMVAFRTREETKNRESVVLNCQGAIDSLVFNLSKGLGKPFVQALEARRVKAEAGSGLVPKATSSGLVPKAAQARPQGPAQPQDPAMDIKARLLRLEELKQKGLITPEEYRAKRDDILKDL